MMSAAFWRIIVIDVARDARRQRCSQSAHYERCYKIGYADVDAAAQRGDSDMLDAYCRYAPLTSVADAHGAPCVTMNR